MNGVISIPKKRIKIVVIFVIVSLPLITSSWFVVCEQIDTKAKSHFNRYFDAYYPVRHASCSTNVKSLSDNFMAQQNDIREMKSSVRLLVMLERQRMTWKEKQTIVEGLIKEDSLSPEAAYNFIQGESK
jgi:hypothetical protein